MTDEALRREYRDGLERSGARGGCPVPEDIAALVAREGAEIDRLATLDHVMSCEACRADFELLRAVDRVRPRVAPSRARILALAASVVLALGAGTWLIRGPLARRADDTVRGGAGGLELVTPGAGAGAARPVVLRWRSAPEVRAYTVELLGEDGAPVGVWSTPDTALMIPDSIALESGRPYAWWVRARRADGSEVRSPMARFRLR